MCSYKKESTHKLSGDFLKIIISLHPTNSKNSKRLFTKCIATVLKLVFCIFNEIYYLHQVPMGHIMSFVQSVAVIVFRV